ncbi:hypothetical protein D9M71_793710 [compost metagenome]
MRNWLKPSLPAASIAVTTAWCGVLPSALMASGSVLSPPDSRAMASLRVARSLLGSRWLFTEYTPSALMVISTSLPGSAGAGSALVASGNSTRSCVSRVKVVVTTKNSSRTNTTSISDARLMSTFSR